MNQDEVWLVNLDPAVDSEIKKTRPVIIINNNNLGKLPLKIIVPLTDWKDRYNIAPWMVKVSSFKTCEVGCLKDNSSFRTVLLNKIL